MAVTALAARQVARSRRPEPSVEIAQESRGFVSPGVASGRSGPITEATEIEKAEREQERKREREVVGAATRLARENFNRFDPTAGGIPGISFTNPSSRSFLQNPFLTRR